MPKGYYGIYYVFHTNDDNLFTSLKEVRKANARHNKLGIFPLFQYTIIHILVIMK